MDYTNRKVAYKTNSLNREEMRMRRHEVTVELRKSKKEAQLFKRRNITSDDEHTSPLKENNAQYPTPADIQRMVNTMSSSVPEEQLAAIQECRKILSRERSPPISLMISHGIVPLCVNLIQKSEHNMLQFEAAWALTNIASGTSEQTRAVMESGAIPHLVKLLRSRSISVAEQCVWALGNIAGDGAVGRDTVINNNAIEHILALLRTELPKSFLRNLAWLMSNLCRNKNPSPPFEQIKNLLPALAFLLDSEDFQVQSDIGWAFSYITDDENTKIQAVIDTGIIPKLVNMLENDDPIVVMPALRTIGNIVTGNDWQTDQVIAAGALPKLRMLLEHTKVNIVKEAAWSVSNITAGNQKQIQAVFDAGIFIQIRNVLEKGDFKSRKEAAWVITNATASCTPENIVDLIEKYKILKPFCDLLDIKDPRSLIIILNGLANMFAVAQKLNGTENLCVLVEECGGLDKLEVLQEHENEEIYKKAYYIMDTYFNSEDDSTGQKEAFDFAGASSSGAAPPEGAFKF